jgi:hypothetical protein
MIITSITFSENPLFLSLYYSSFFCRTFTAEQKLKDVPFYVPIEKLSVVALGLQPVSNIGDLTAAYGWSGIMGWDMAKTRLKQIIWNDGGVQKTTSPSPTLLKNITQPAFMTSITKPCTRQSSPFTPSQRSNKEKIVFVAESPLSILPLCLNEIVQC